MSSPLLPTATTTAIGAREWVGGIGEPSLCLDIGPTLRAGQAGMIHQVTNQHPASHSCPPSPGRLPLRLLQGYPDGRWSHFWHRSCTGTRQRIGRLPVLASVGREIHDMARAPNLKPSSASQRTEQRESRRNP
jgi:hypothetical protein